MAIRPVKNKFQVDVAVTIDGKVRRHRETLDTFDAAKTREAEVKFSLLKNGTIPPKVGERTEVAPREYTLRRCLEECNKTYWKQARSGRGLYLNGATALKFFGEEADIRNITFQRIEDYKIYLRNKPLKNGSINRKLASLSKILTWAQDMGLIKDRPRIGFAKKTPGRRRYISDTEEVQIMEYFSAVGLTSYKDICVILLDTGARPSEIFKRPRTEWSKDEGVLKFWDTKTNVPRIIPVTDRAMAALDRVWADVRSGKLTYRMFLTQWQAMKITMGLEDDKEFIPYCLRHTCCTRLISRGADIITVLKWMGHESIATTQGYAHLVGQNLQKALKLLQTG